MIRQRMAIAVFVLMPFTAPLAHAAPIVAGTTVLPGRAIQDITPLANTAWLMTDSGVMVLPGPLNGYHARNPASRSS